MISLLCQQTAYFGLFAQIRKVSMSGYNLGKIKYQVPPSNKRPLSSTKFEILQAPRALIQRFTVWLVALV